MDYDRRWSLCDRVEELETMTQMKILQNLYDSEINFSIQTFWDGGFDVKLGDHMNGFSASTTVETAEEIIDWLHISTIKHFPDSQYTKENNNGN